MQRYIYSIFLLIALGLSACAEIPQEAVEANQQVTTGVKALQANSLTLIDAWESTGYMVLDSKFGDVYMRADDIYRSRKNIDPKDVLTPEQQREVAGLAALIREAVRKQIAAEAQKLRQIVNGNAKTTVEANDSITRLLVSANKLTGARSGLITRVQGLLPIPDAINKFISDTVEKISDLSV